MTGKKNSPVVHSASAAQQPHHMNRSRPIENPPWILWRVWSRSIHQKLAQHFEDDHCYLSALYISRMFYDSLNAWGLPFDPKGSSFHIFEVRKIRRFEQREDDGNKFTKAVLDLTRMKCADVSSVASDKWSALAVKDLAEVLLDTLDPNDYLIVWGGRINSETRIITLNFSVNTQICPKSFMAIYRHGEIQPLQNGHQQHHIPFNSRGVHNSFVKIHGLEDSTVQKICPLTFEMTTETVDTSNEQTDILNHTPNVTSNDGMNGCNSAKKKPSERCDAKLNSTNSLSKSSVSRVVQVDLEDEDIMEPETFSSHSTPNRNDAGRSKTKHSTSNRVEVSVVPLTRRNILLHTKSQSELRTSKESSYVIEKFVSEESVGNITSPDGIRPSRMRNSQPRTGANISQSSQESPQVSQEQQRKPVRCPSESPDEFSQDVLIELDSQYFPLENGGSPEHSRNIQGNVNSQSGPSPTRVEPGMSQYSTGRMLSELDKYSQELLGEDGGSGSCCSDSSGKTIERVPAIVPTKRLSELKRCVLFHLRCKIHKVHTNQSENIAMLSVSDGTIPPFCPKQLFPVLGSPRKIPDQETRLMATLHADILIRNANPLMNLYNAQSEEVLLTYVAIEKDERKCVFFTMDGNRSEIQEIVEETRRNAEEQIRSGNTINSNQNSTGKISQSSSTVNVPKPDPVRKSRKLDTSASSSRSGSLYDPREDNAVPSASKRRKTRMGESPRKMQKPGPQRHKKTENRIPSSSNKINAEHEELKMQDVVVKIEKLDMTGLKEGLTVNLSQFYSTSSQNSNKSSSPIKHDNSHVQDLDPQPSTSARHRTRDRSGSRPSEEKTLLTIKRDRVARNKSRNANIIEIDLSDTNSENNSDASDSGGKKSKKKSNGGSNGKKRKQRRLE